MERRGKDLRSPCHCRLGDTRTGGSNKRNLFNGNPETYFINRDAKPRFFNAVWSKRKDGFAIDCNLSFLHGDADNPLSEPVRLSGHAGEAQDVQLCGQRNWIPKNPIRIIRGLANCYASSKPLIESIERELIPELNRGMRPGVIWQRPEHDYT